MKNLLEQLLADAVQTLQQNGILPADLKPKITITRSRDASHGDFACNLALMLAKPANVNPRDLARALIDALPDSERIIKIDIAGPGFINFFMAHSELHAVIPEILASADCFGYSDTGKGQKIQVEYVSANPKGSLHVGHGRTAALGASIANLLSATGYDVQRAYFVYDAGRQTLLGADDYRVIIDHSLDTILDDIRADLSEFGVLYDNWFSERSLTTSVAAVIEKLKASGTMYQQDGAWWLRATELGDTQDWVLIRDNGQATHFASDIAYLLNKLQRGFDKVVYLVGADHHGYVGRMLAAVEALGFPRGRIEFLLVQFANIYSSGAKQQITTRSSEPVTLRLLLDEVGKDAARYFCAMRRYKQPLEFDLDLATSQTRDNPVYNVQYAHARICSVQRQARDKGLPFDQAAGLANLMLLSQPHETRLLTLLGTYPETVERAARLRETHLVTSYLQELANGLNNYYEAHKWLIEDKALRQARMCLILAAKQVLVNGLRLIDVSAPEVL